MTNPPRACCTCVREAEGAWHRRLEATLQYTTTTPRHLCQGISTRATPATPTPDPNPPPPRINHQTQASPPTCRALVPYEVERHVPAARLAVVAQHRHAAPRVLRRHGVLGDQHVDVAPHALPVRRVERAAHADGAEAHAVVGDEAVVALLRGGAGRCVVVVAGLGCVVVWMGGFVVVGVSVWKGGFGHAKPRHTSAPSPPPKTLHPQSTGDPDQPPRPRPDRAHLVDGVAAQQHRDGAHAVKEVLKAHGAVLVHAVLDAHVGLLQRQAVAAVAGAVGPRGALHEEVLQFDKCFSLRGWVERRGGRGTEGGKQGQLLLGCCSRPSQPNRSHP